MSDELKRGMEAMSRYASEEDIARAFPKPKCRWIVFWYDGSGNRATLVDFGDDPTAGPFGHEEDIILAIYDALDDDEKFDEGRALIHQSDIMIAGMVYADTIPSVVIDDKEVEIDINKSVTVKL